MKQIKWPWALSIFFSGLVHAAGPNTDWNTFTAWVGNAPSTKLVGRQTLLGQPAIHAALKQLLPKAEQTALATVVIDPVNQKLWAGFFTREENRVSTRWYGMTDDYSVLPESVRKGFLERHGN